MNEIDRLKSLIKDLRRGTNQDKNNYHDFVFYVEVLFSDPFLSTCLLLRDKISIVDTFADHGRDTIRAQALIISTFCNLIKISDTFLQYNEIKTNKQPESNGVFHLYDGVNSLRLAYDDMPSVLFFRIERSLIYGSILFVLWRSILADLKQHSKTLHLASRQNPLFFEPQFFPGRKNFLGLEYPDNELYKQLHF